MKLKWLGHASWKLKAGGKTIYIDPYEGDYDEKADIILASHSHTDHCEPSKVKEATGDGTVVIAPADCAEKIGAPVRSLKPGEKAEFGEVTVKAVEAYNVKRFRSPGVPFHPKGLGVGYIVKAEGKKVYHVGDSDYIPEMDELKDIDVLLIPSGGTYTMDAEDAAEATVAINPKIAVPVHIWDTDPGEYKKKVEAASGVKVMILKPGDTFDL
ncbi:MBL fold metallo-hydrolase [Candidatus Bathyarchaeota archaeon]|nr:MBL fold metallo-hydrolase [Candidatus Bathyarchaeota archaeon]